MDELSPVFHSVSKYFGLLAEPMRVRILHCICQQEKSVNQIVLETGGTQTNVSRHLSTLFNAGVLSRRKEGTLVMYSVSDATLTELCRTVCVQIATKMEEQSHAASAPQVFLGVADAMTPHSTAPHNTLASQS